SSLSFGAASAEPPRRDVARTETNRRRMRISFWSAARIAALDFSFEDEKSKAAILAALQITLLLRGLRRRRLALGDVLVVALDQRRVLRGQFLHQRLLQQLALPRRQVQEHAVAARVAGRGPVVVGLAVGDAVALAALLVPLLGAAGLL